MSMNSKRSLKNVALVIIAVLVVLVFFLSPRQSSVIEVLDVLEDSVSEEDTLSEIEKWYMSEEGMLEMMRGAGIPPEEAE